MADKKRLIDANALMEQFDECNFKGFVMKRLIEMQPTVDAVEVVHGRWLKLSPWNHNTQSCLCLNCDKITYMRKAGVYIGEIPNYCPVCGAKMDGERKTE